MNAGLTTRPGVELLLTPAEAAALLDVTVTELEAARAAGNAPAHIQLGPRTVRYFRVAVQEAVSARGAAAASPSAAAPGT